MPNYIQKFATIEQSCDWLRARTGGVWTLPRLLECHLKPYFWLDYKPGYEELFGGRVEGYRTWMIFAGDVQRLEFDGTSALVNMIAAPDGTPVPLNPGWVLPLTELRFKREALERVATILEGKAGLQAAATSGAQEKAAPPVSVVMPTEKSKDGPAWYDIEKERGCRRLILENWKTIASTCGPGAKASQILRHLKMLQGSSAELPTLKTIHNCRKQLLDEKLIP